MTVRAKICGIRSPKDLRVARDAGADALGFISGVTHYSEDALTTEAARRLVRLVPPYISTVLVTHLVSAQDILALASEIGVDIIQVHGLVDVNTLAAVWEGAQGNYRVVGVVHVEDERAIQAALAAREACDAVHLDSRTLDRLGGTGKTHDWEISSEIVRELSATNVPVILSGGLTPSNLVYALDTVRPFAVDANSGLEDSEGNKNLERCTKFVSLSHQAAFVS